MFAFENDAAGPLRVGHDPLASLEASCPHRVKRDGDLVLRTDLRSRSSVTLYFTHGSKDTGYKKNPAQPDSPLPVIASQYFGCREETVAATLRAMPTKAELLAALASSRDDVVDGSSGLDLSIGVYEGGWNGHGLLAHIASMEWTYPRILELPAATDEEAARR